MAGAAPKFYERMTARNEQLAQRQAPTVHLDHIIDMRDDGWQRVLDISLNGMFYNSGDGAATDGATQRWGYR